MRESNSRFLLGKQAYCHYTNLAHGADGRIRTADLCFTKALLWPTELHRHKITEVL